MNLTDRCLDEQAALAFVEGRMPAKRREEIERHVDLCERCRQLLGALALLRKAEGTGAAEAAPVSPSNPDRYAVVAEYARGGQARVMIAFDENVGREVALKELLPRTAEGVMGDDSWRDASARFLREAELTGQLVHPGIVPVFEIGQRPDGTLFYTMQLVHGRTLSEVLRERKSLPERLKLLSHFLAVCHVVAYAHSRGVLHRDLKPQNIMVGEYGETVLLDWGLAKEQGERDWTSRITARSGFDEAADATLEGTVVGTPGYMSPEQASGNLAEVDERSDIYGLGAVLFEILAGSAPPPPAPDAAGTPRVRAFCSEAPAELVAVAEKALAASKAERYQQASDLAQDVTAFMTGARVAAYAYTGRDLLWRFASRHRLLLGAAGIAAAAILTALVLTSVAWRSELTSRLAAAAQGREAMQEGAKLALVQGDALQARAKLRGALELGDSLEARSLWRTLRSDPERFVAPFGSQSYAVSFSPDGQTLAVALQGASVQLLDTITRATRVLRSRSDQLISARFSPDGRFLAAGALSGPIALWDLERGALSYLGENGSEEALAPRALSFDAAGAFLASPGEGGTVVVWDLRTRTVRARLQMTTRRVMSVSLTADGRRLLASGQDCKAMIWDVDKRAPELTLSEAVDGTAFSPDGALAAGAGYDGNVYLWDGATGQLPRALRGHRDRINRVAVSPDGKLLASASNDRTVRLWSLPKGEALRTLSTAKSIARDVSFSPDSRLLAAAAGDSAWLWDLAVPQEPSEPLLTSGSLNAGRFSPDGARIASAGSDGLVRLWETSSGGLRASLARHESVARDVCFSPDEKLLASVGYDGMLLISDAETGVVQHRLAHGDGLWNVACAPDNRHVASGGFDATVRIWDLVTGDLVRVLPGRPPFTVMALGYAPDGRRLAVGRQGGSIELWDVSSGRRVFELTGHTQGVAGLVFDASGKGLASASLDQTIRLWNTADGTGRILGKAAGRAFRIAWDGPRERLLVPTSKGEIELLSLVGAPPVRVKVHGDEVNSIELSPDGETALTAGDDGVLRLWDAAAWRPKWIARALVWAPEPQILTHTGWHAVDTVSRRLVSFVPRAASWRRAVEASREAVARPKGPLCLATENGLELWDIEADRRVADQSIPEPFDVVALSSGCSVLKDGKATLLLNGVAPIEVARDVTFQSGGKELLLLGPEVTLFDPRGAALESFGPGAGAVAAAQIGDHVALGFRDGGIELRGPNGRPVPVVFQEKPGIAVTRLAAGPSGTLVAGFADGRFGVWSTSSGARLAQGGIHGPVRHLALRDEMLVVAGEVGSLASVDLRLLVIDYCDLLREVWSQVPVAWSGQGALLRAPDPTHRCWRGSGGP